MANLIADESNVTVVPQPEPGLTREVLLARADALIPLLRDQQEESDKRGYYSDVIHRKFMDAGFYRAVQPKMFGGYEFGWTTFFELVTRIGRGHPSTAWCFTLAASHSVVVGSYFGERAQRALFGPIGDFRAPHRAPPAGKWKRADGGWIGSGTWSFSSGVPVSNHFGGGALLPDKNGDLVAISFYVPREKITIVSDWGGDASLGMQGSGSHSVRLEEVFVPDHHIIWGDLLLGMNDPVNGTPGYKLHRNPLYLGVMGGPFHLTFAAMFLGTARAALDEYRQLIQNTSVVGNPGKKMFQQNDVQYALGEALMLADLAEATLFGAARRFEGFGEKWVKDRTPITAAETMEIWAMARQSTMMSCKAVEQLFHSGGPRIGGRGQKLQRYIRDVQMYRIHPSSQPWVVGARAQTQLGLPIDYFAARP